MATTDLVVGIAAEYKGKPAFNKANKDILGLSKGVKTLAKGYIGLQGAQKAYAFGKASLAAFVQDDKAARQLSKTVTNLGLAYEATNVENFVQGLEKVYHVNDDLLRPSFAKLIQVTQSYTKSKELLTTALDASAGAGVDLTTTVQDLSQAYVGNLRGLRKYNLGLTQAELAGMSFEQILSKINETFSGQASLAADTYSGKLDALTIASNNAKETIGKGLVDALTATAGKKGDIEGLVKDIETLANAAANTARFFGQIFGFIGKIVSATDKLTGGYQAAQAKKNKVANAPYNPMNSVGTGLTAKDIKLIKERQKADALAAKRQKELVALTAKQTGAIKEQTALQKAKAIFDKTSMIMNMELIQNTAALQNKVSEDEKLRLKLQQAILMENADAAAKLGQELLTAQLAAVMASNTDPFGNWMTGIVNAIDGIIKLREEIGLLSKPLLTPAQQLLASDYSAALLDSVDMSYQLVNDETQQVLDMFKELSNLPKLPMPTSSYTQSTGNFTYGQNNPLAVQVFVDPAAMAYGINAAVVGANANGGSSTVNRNGFFNYGG
jgi:hypothetical protein